MSQADQKTASVTGFLATIVILTFVMNTVGRGVTETFAVFLLPVQKGLGLSRAEVTSTYSVYMLASGLSAPFAGQLADRFGGRVTYGVGLACLGGGYVCAGYVHNLWQYMICVGLLAGLGVSAIGMVAASALLTRWFTKSIGVVVALPYAAGGVGMLVMPPLAQYLLAHFDWRTTHQVLGLTVLAIIPALFVLPLSRMTAGSPDWQEMRAIEIRNRTMPWRVSTAVRTGAFWALFGVYFFTSVAAYSVLPHSVAYLIERGFGPLFSASAFGLTGLLSAAGIIGMGWLSDRIGRRTAATLSYISTITGILSLILVTLVPSAVLVYAFLVFFGLMQGARGPIIVALTSLMFPGGGLGAIFGTLSAAQGLGAAMGSWSSGALYELTGDYVASFASGALAAAIAMSLFWITPSLRQERVYSRPTAEPAP